MDNKLVAKEIGSITCWDEVIKEHIKLSLSASVKQTMEQWGCLDYVVSKELIEDSAKEVQAVMKKLGYKLVTNSSSHYRHYTNLSKPVPTILEAVIANTAALSAKTEV